jgi:hypothetical protein
VNIKGVKSRVYFEVIEIMDDSDPYPTLLGIDWEFDNNVIFYMKKYKISFKTYTFHIIVSLDPHEGDIYNELVNEDA